MRPYRVGKIAAHPLTNLTVVRGVESFVFTQRFLLTPKQSRAARQEGTTETLPNKLSKNANVTTSSVLTTAVQPTYVHP
jgi:hypothetical protein